MRLAGEEAKEAAAANREQQEKKKSKMPEIRHSGGVAVGPRRPLNAGALSGGGFFIRTVSMSAAGPTTAVKQHRQWAAVRRRRQMTAEDNKENVPPPWAISPAGSRARRSPLPEWYPRTPLRDITTIVKAVERKSRLKVAAARQQNQRTEDFLQTGNPTTPSRVECLVSDRAPPEDGMSSTPDPNLGLIVASPASSSAEGELKAASTLGSLSPSDCSLQTPTVPKDPALAAQIEKKLTSSIEEIEKMVRRNMKQTPKAARPSKRAIQMRTLMSMR